jgi:N-acetylmuramic acid 6-phosphate etherase
MVDLCASNAKLVDRALRIVLSQCDISRADAEALLDRAGGSVKLALVMARRGVDAARARELLDEHAGSLRAILGPPEPPEPPR